MLKKIQVFIKNILILIISLIFPVIFLYPQGILYGTYLNYIYVAMCAFILFLIRRSFHRTFALIFFSSVFLLNFFSNVISLFLGRIDYLMVINGSAPFFLGLCVSYIISNFPVDKLHYLKISVFITFIFTLFLILLDGTTKPSWMYPIFYIHKNKVLTDLVSTFHHRAIGSLLSPVMSGFFCVTIMTYSFVQVVYSKRYKYFHIGLLGVSAITMLLTTSRTAMLALALMLICFLLFFPKDRKSRSNLIFLLLAVIIFLSVLNFSFLNDAFVNLQHRDKQFSTGVFQGTGRAATFSSALKYKFDSRCLVWGIGTAEYSIVENTKFSLAHNGFLSIFLPLGLMGVIFYTMMFYRYIRLSFQQYTLVINLFISMWCILSIGTFLSADLPVSFFYIALQAIILSFSDRINEPNNKSYI